MSSVQISSWTVMSCLFVVVLHTGGKRVLSLFMFKQETSVNPRMVVKTSFSVVRLVYYQIYPRTHCIKTTQSLKSGLLLTLNFINFKPIQLIIFYID